MGFLYLYYIYTYISKCIVCFYVRGLPLYIYLIYYDIFEQYGNYYNFKNILLKDSDQ